MPIALISNFRLAPPDAESNRAAQPFLAVLLMPRFLPPIALTPPPPPP